MDSIIGKSKFPKVIRLAKIALSLILGIASGIMAVYGFPVSLENMTADVVYQNADVIPNNIKIIAIDEKTLSVLGPYRIGTEDVLPNLLICLMPIRKKPPP